MEKIKEIKIGSKAWLKHGQITSLPKSWAVDVGLDQGGTIIVYRDGNNLVLKPQTDKTKEITLYKDKPEDSSLLLGILNVLGIDEKSVKSITIGNGNFTIEKEE